MDYLWRGDDGRQHLKLSLEGDELVVTRKRRSRRVPLAEVTGFFVRNEAGGARLYVSWKSSGRVSTMRERCEQGDELVRFLDALAARAPKGADLRGTSTEAAPTLVRVGAPVGLWVAVALAAVVIA